MKLKMIGLAIVCSVMITGSASAGIISIDISPLAGSALNSVNYLNGDHALGLTAINAVGQPASAATGNEIGGGITFDDVSKVLSYDVGYGSNFGFSDLLGDYTVAHIHGPAVVQFPAPNTGAGVVVGLTHAPGTTTKTGSFTGTTLLSASQEADLMDNLLYINVHSTFAGGGEIRGQLVPVIPEPASLTLLLVSGVIIWRVRGK